MITTEYEEKIIHWLDKRRIDYNFASELEGGRPEFGGYIMPFILDEDIVLRIDSQDTIQKEVIENAGYIMVDIKSDDLDRNIDTVMNKAIQGEEIG